ncbi:polysaccharide biosynthesis C-terminal domain-containing protein [Paraflavisolibacter sp. H34]|uniref:polysaccharide biosynthesis C-terminal domain-containing protein n=1 Tax=Huijunlia imazamoxiresistens TaxID=3127457 RepID=UPI0030174D77
MSTIRRQTIISSLLIYIGFAFGALNTYLFTRDGIFTPEQYGLTRAFIVMGQFFFGFAGFGISSVIYKFYPYYKDNLPAQKNDLLTVGLLVSLVGFILTASGGLLFENIVVRKFIDKSPLILRYYYWVFPFTFFLLYFSVLESYAWSLGKTIVPNFLREAGFRISTTLLIVLFLVTGKNFDLFIKLFSLLYAFSFVALVVYLVRLKEFNLVNQVSRVTVKFRKKILALIGFVYGGSLVNVAAQSVDFLAIASFKGLQYGAVFDFSNYVANVIQVPQRSLVSVSISPLARAWKDKDYATIDRIYKRSSINLLLVSTFLFGIIWLNYDSGVRLLGLNPIYEEGKWVFFLLGVKNIVDMGTGVNGQIIGTSTYWRFDFFSGIILLLLIIPLNIFMVRRFGIMGSAWSGLISYLVYNTIRVLFLKFKFNLQPFSARTVFILLNALGSYLVAYYLFQSFTGWTGIFLRSIVFVLLFIGITLYFRLSPDLQPVLETLKKKLGIRKAVPEGIGNEQ